MNNADLIVLADNAITEARNYLNTFPANSSSPEFISANQYLAYITLIRNNLAQGTSPKTIIMQGGDLCMVAATYYGDAELGFALAAYNGLIVPNLAISVLYTITLPPAAALSG